MLDLLALFTQLWLHGGGAHTNDGGGGKGIDFGGPERAPETPGAHFDSLAARITRTTLG
jgi:hypothetical protein